MLSIYLFEVDFSTNINDFYGFLRKRHIFLHRHSLPKFILHKEALKMTKNVSCMMHATF